MKSIILIIKGVLMSANNDLEIFLKNMNNEYIYNKQFKQRAKYMFDYVYRLKKKKKDITKQIELLEKLNINAGYLVKKLDDINRQLSALKR